MENQKVRFMKKVPGGVMVEDDGGFLNYFPTKDVHALGSIMGMGADSDTSPNKVAKAKGFVVETLNVLGLKLLSAFKIKERREPVVIEAPKAQIDNVIYIAEWKARKGR